MVQPVLSRLVAANDASDGENIFERARQVLLEEVVARVQQDSALGSALMGVAAPHLPALDSLPAFLNPRRPAPFFSAEVTTISADSAKIVNPITLRRGFRRS